MRGGEIILSTAAANDTELVTPCDGEGEELVFCPHRLVPLRERKRKQRDNICRLCSVLYVAGLKSHRGCES